VQPTRKAGEGNGEAPVKVCDHCHELCHLSAQVCPACGEAFPERKPPKLKLHNDDIMGLEGTEMPVTGWNWRIHTSRTSGKEMLAVTYYGGLSDPPITEYFPVTHEGYAGQKAVTQIAHIAMQGGMVAGGLATQSLEVMVHNLSHHTNCPRLIEYRKDGKFFRVTKRTWND
jgi:DNA repair protein RadD